MLDREKRLNEVYEFLRNNFGIHTKSDFADSIKYARAYISSALNGNKRYLTDKLFANICDAFPGVFNLDYLLTGHGSLLAEQVIHDEDNIRITESIDPSSLINAALAAKDETIAAIREQLEAKDELILALREQLEALRQQLKIARQQLDSGIKERIAMVAEEVAKIETEKVTRKDV